MAQEVLLRDVGGVEPSPGEILSDELITYLDGINSTLGTKDDPRFGDYQEFCRSIDEASILKIEPDQVSSGKYEDLDLTGDGEQQQTVTEVTADSFKQPGMSLADWYKMIFTAQAMSSVYGNKIATSDGFEFLAAKVKTVIYK